MKRRRKRSVIVMMVVLYIAAAGMLLYHIHPQVQALGKKTVTLDIGAGDDRVKAVLTEKGILTLSGKGRTRDYTEETAPFQEYADRVTSVVIGEGITGIGDCLFYNCGNLKGNLVLPSTVIWIGDQAFSGSDYESAPKFAAVISKFASADIAIPKAGEVIPGTNPTEEVASPGNAAGPGSESKENGEAGKPSEATPSEAETEKDGGEESQSPAETEENTETKASETERESSGSVETEAGTAGTEDEEAVDPETSRGTEPETSKGAEQEESGALEAQAAFVQMSATGGKSPVFFKATSGNRRNIAAEPEVVKAKLENIQSNYQDENASSDKGGQASESQDKQAGADQNGSSSKNQGKQEGADQSGSSSKDQGKQDGMDENDSALKDQDGSASEDQDDGTGTDGNGSASENQGSQTGTDGSGQAAGDHSASKETTSATLDETEEDEREGVLENDLYSGAVELYRIDQAMLSYYTVETITSQIMGEEVFYPGQRGAYSAEDANTAFIDAAEAAGYRKAERFITVNMEGVEDTVPVVDGAFYSPDLPAEVESPGEEDDPLFYEVFTGWTMESDWETMGDEAPCYAPGTAVPIAEDVTSIKLYANWEKTCALDLEVAVQPGENQTVYQAIDGETGEILSEPEGYRITYQWQICAPVSRMAEEDMSVGDAELLTDETLQNDLEYGPGTVSLTTEAEVGPGVAAVKTGSGAAETEVGPGVAAAKTGAGEAEAEIGPGVAAAKTGLGAAETEAGSGVAGLEAGSGVTQVAADSGAAEMEAGPGASGTEAGSGVAGAETGPGSIGVETGSGMTGQEADSGAAEAKAAPNAAETEASLDTEAPGVAAPKAAPDTTAPGTAEADASLDAAPPLPAEVGTAPELYPSDPSDESNWQDIEGANEAMYARESGREDELSYFRVKISIDKRTYFRSVTEPVILYSTYAEGNYTLKSIIVTYAPGDGDSGTGPEPDTVLEGEAFVPKDNTFTRTDSKVFIGWKPSFNGSVLKKPSGAAITAATTLPANCSTMILEAANGAAAPTMTLTAQWGEATIIYVDQTNGKDDGTNDGRTESAPVKSLKKAFELLPSGGSAETNIIQLLSNYTLSDGYMENKSTLRNVTICGKGYQNTTLNITVTAFNLQGDTTFRDINVSLQCYFACNAYNLVLESTAGISGKSLLGSSGEYTFGAPADCTDSHIMARNNDSFNGTFGTRGTTQDNPTILKLMGEYSNIGRVMGGSRIPKGYLTSQDNPFYADITVGGGKVGVVASGSVKAGADYINTDVHVNGGTIASVVGGQHYSGSVATLYGTYRVFMNGGKITNLCGGPEGRSRSTDSRSNLTSELNIFGGQIENVYGGGTTGKFEGTVQIDVNGGEIKNFYGGGYGYSRFVQSYDNDTATLVGTVTANINGGKIVNNVYAGGRGSKEKTGSAVITGDIILNITGGEIGGDVFGGGGGIPEDATAAKITGTSTVNITGGTIAGNVYGGGDLASVGGKVTISISGNPSIGKNIYGGGNTSGSIGSADVTINAPFGVTAGTQSVYGGGNGSATVVSGNAKVTVGSSADIYGTVFGGGEMGTVASTQLQLLSGGKIHGNVYGGGNAAAVNGTVEINALSGSNITGDLYGGSNSSEAVTGLITINSAGEVRNIFGAGNGSSTEANGGTRVTVQNGASVSGNVYGGGEQGTVTQTEVVLSGGTITGSVFGGGNRVGTSRAIVTLSDGPTITGNIYGGSNVEGETTVSEITVGGTRLDDIYGGGWGENTTVLTSNVTAQSGSVIKGSLFGGGLKGEVKKSNVLLKANSQVTKAFGGGSDANVTEASLVTVENGGKVENIYGGSNNSGTVKGAVVTIYGEAVNAYGAGKGSGTITESPQIIAENGAKVTNLYGGGQEGQTIVGSTVTLKNGSFVTNTFGGGNAAGVTGTAAASGTTATTGTGVATVTTESGSKAVNIYGGSNSKGTVDKTVITIGGTVGDSSADTEGAVYGGGLGKNTVTGTTQVTIASSGIIFGGNDKGIFGGGAQGPVTGDTAVILDATKNITGNVYAGGDEAVVKGSTELRLNDGTEMTGSLFGGGKGATAEIETDTRVIVFAKVTGNVFGGGALGPVKGSTHVDIAKGTVEGDGVNTGNVFGGSDQAKVTGDTLVHIGKEAADGWGVSVSGVSLTIYGTVFGGGNTTDNGKAFDSTTPFVLGSSHVSVDATDYNVSNFNIAKSIFGDGNMCTVRGDRTVLMKNYTALGNQANTSIQRATKLTLDNCRVELSGATDSANLVPTIAYSLNRIDDLILKGGSTLKIQNSVNLVKKLESVSSSGAPVTTASTENTGVEPATKNYLYIKQGYNLELRTSEDVTTPEYGSVSGYTILGSYDEVGVKIENGVYVQGDYHSDPAAGGFLSAETENLYQWIKPSTDNKTWRIWALGTNMTRNGVLVMSNKPAGEKIYQFDSPWPADGSIYRLEPDIEITTADSYGGAAFVIKAPDSVQAPDSPDTTLGLTLKTGAIGWTNQTDVAHIEGSSAAGSNNHFGNLSSEKMQTLNNRSIKPQFRVELTNLPGIGEVDTGYPLTVQFKMQNIKENPDGTETPQGTLTVILEIRRNGSLTYEDILLATGKEYERANLTYTFNQQSVSPGATITQGSAATLQYAKKEDSETTGGYGVQDHKLSFTTWESGSESAAVLPQGVTILAIDRASQTDAPAYYHYTVPSGGISEVLLSKFVKNGTADEPYQRTFGVNEAENFLFILDFAGAPSYSKEKLCAAFEPIYQGGSTPSKPARVVFTISGSPKKYQLTSADMTGETGEGKAYERDGVIPVSLTVSATATVGVDTTGTDLRVGARFRLKNRDAGTYVSVPKDWILNGEVKNSNILKGHLDVLLGNNMTEMTVGTEIAMKESSLPAGNYQWEIHLLSAPVVNYPGTQTGTPIYVNFSLTDKRYSIAADFTDPSEKRLYEAEAAAADRKPMEFTVKLAAANGAAVEGVSQKVSLWKKNETTGTYESVNMDTLFTDATGAAMSYAWSENSTMSYTLKPSVSPGTYRLRFELIKTAEGSDQLLTYDTVNFIVIPD